MRSNQVIKYRKILSFLISNKGYLGPLHINVDRSIFSSLLGTRNNFIYYDLQNTITGTKNVFEIIEKMIVHRGRLLIVGGSLNINSILLCLSNIDKSNIAVIPWCFSSISRMEKFDLLLLQEVHARSQLEAYNKMRPYIGVNSLTSRDLSYLINLNLKDPVLLNWYLYLLVFSCRRGFYYRIKNYRNEI